LPVVWVFVDETEHCRAFFMDTKRP
jgi:hypothetical protein